METTASRRYYPAFEEFHSFIRSRARRRSWQLILLSLGDMRASFFAASVWLLFASCTFTPPEPAETVVTLSQRETSQLLTSALRYWISKHPLPRRARCYVFIEDRNGHRTLPEFAEQFPEYGLIVRYGSPDNQSPRPYYSLFVGRTSRDHAFVLTADPFHSAFVELRRQRGDWRVVGERPDIII